MPTWWEGFSGGTVVKNLPPRAGETGNASSVPGSGRCPREGYSSPLQYSCLGTSRGQSSLIGSRPWGRKESDMTERTIDTIWWADWNQYSKYTSLIFVVCVCSIAKPCRTFCDLLDCSPSRLLCPWDFPGKNIGVDCHFLLQVIFLIQGENLHLLLGRWILYHWTTT